MTLQYNACKLYCALSTQRLVSSCHLAFDPLYRLHPTAPLLSVCMHEFVFCLLVRNKIFLYNFVLGHTLGQQIEIKDFYKESHKTSLFDFVYVVREFKNINCKTLRSNPFSKISIYETNI